MTTKIRIDFEQVQQAADSLLAKGEKPTVNAIRSILGKGSNSTILQHLQAWREAQPVQQKKAIVLPDSIIRSIHVEIEKAEAAGRAEVEAMLIEAREQIQALLDEISDHEKHAEQIEEQLESAISQKDKALSFVVAHEATIAELRSQASQVALDYEKKSVEQAKLLSAATREADRFRIELAKAELKAESITKLESELSELRKASTLSEVLQAKLDAANEKIRLQAVQIEQLSKVVEANNSRLTRIANARNRTTA
jgi:chromosome segregation ATPase